ncbi:MAG: VWA domain-containing protein [Lentisphaerae bacterium RIFOXYB12_FULL_65_16]|nr:MAG: VWA domain-containing protein [Lentisphaerae bacterium RIFOXYA12_64_32]OGV92715.1 MAG: VWA domain-containing protein [Lentisphaerae bacterium RIFOXYB12_FULL_65_16]
MKTKVGRTCSRNRVGIVGLAVIALLVCFAAAPVEAAGLLKVKGQGDDGLSIRSHQASVVIDNGFARTEVDQVFANAAATDLECFYTFPLPKQASLSELSLWIDGREVLGEVVEKEKARKIYEEEKAKGNDTALAEKNDYKTFDILVGRIPARSEARVRLVYYQPLEIDMGVGRYVYPLAEGNVDDNRVPFWDVADKVDSGLQFHLELKSAFPVKECRVPGFEQVAAIQPVTGAEGERGHFTVDLNLAEGARLDKDVVFYYRLDETVPARVELVPYRATPQEDGTFMVVVTPAADLKRIAEGSDWVFVLDKSGSMSGEKIGALADGVARVIGKMSPNDRFRIITFDSRAADFTGSFVPATEANVKEWTGRVRQLQGDGSTALFDGLTLGYRCLDADRTSAVILVTDGVCNVGPTEHSAFLKLLRSYDIRLFTFVIGNSANQPLMERLAKDSGGFAMNISTGDDIYGRLIQAKAKVLNECLHDVRLKFHGEKVYDLAPAALGNLYYGQQLVMFGRFRGDGPVQVELAAKISGEEQTWTCTAELPQQDTDNPEIERLWALARIDDVMEEIREKGESNGLVKKVVDLGVDYSLVTDYTSMVVVREEVFENQGIARNNAARVSRERQAQAVRQQAPARNYQVDNTPANPPGGAFRGLPAPSIGGGSGPVGPAFLVLLAALGLARKRRE